MTKPNDEAPQGASWTWGTRRFWIDETANEMLALSARYVAAMGNMNAFVWRRDSGALVRTFPGFRRPADSWFDDERSLLCMRGGDGRVVVCNLRSGEVSEREASADDPPQVFVAIDRSGYKVTVTWPDRHVTSLHYPNQTIGHVSVALAAGRLAVPHSSVVDTLDRDGKVLQTFKRFGMVALAPDGRAVALADLSCSRVTLGDVETGALQRFDEPQGRVAQLDFSPDGSRLLINAGYSVWLLDAADRSLSARLTGCPSPRSVAADAIAPDLRWSPDGSRLAGSAGHQIVRWDASTGAVERSIALDPRLRVEVLSLDERGERAAALCFMYPGGLMFMPPDEAIVWDLARGTELARVPLEEEESYGWLRLSPDGRTLALRHGEGVRLVGLPQRPGEPLGEEVRLAAAQWGGFVHDGLRVEWEAEDKLTVQRVEGGVVVAERSYPWGLSFAATRDQRRFAVGFGDGRIEVVDAADFSRRARLLASGKVEALTISPRGDALAAGGWDATVEGFALPAL